MNGQSPVNDGSPAPAPAPPRRPLRPLAALYLKLGTIAFGGPAAHIALMEDEVVRRLCWLTPQQFLDLLGVASLIPGPSSTETALYVGYAWAGVPGLLVAGVCFILPAMLMVGGLAWGYMAYGHVPVVQGILYGIKPVIIALVVQALWRLGKTAVKSKFLAAIGLLALVATACGISMVAVLFAAGFVNLFAQAITTPRTQYPGILLPLTTSGAVATTAVAATSPSFTAIFLVFLKLGSVVFGSGYVLLAFLRQDLIVQHHWLMANGQPFGEAQLLDSVVIGQVTPGPVFTTATFIGYLLGGPQGALLATAGIFLPAFFFVGITAPMVRRLRESKTAGAFLDGLNVASLALMAVVTWQLGQAALTDWLTLLLAALSLVLLLWKNLNSIWLIAAGGSIGWLWILAFAGRHG